VADEESFRDFVRARAPALSRAAHLLTGDHHLAQDLVQSALAATYRHWSRIHAGNPEAYVRRAMHRAQISWWRRRRPAEVAQPYDPTTSTGGSCGSWTRPRRPGTSTPAAVARRGSGVVAGEPFAGVSSRWLERQLGEARVRFAPADRAFLATLLHRLPRGVLPQIRLLVLVGHDRFGNHHGSGRGVFVPLVDVEQPAVGSRSAVTPIDLGLCSYQPVHEGHEVLDILVGPVRGQLARDVVLPRVCLAEQQTTGGGAGDR
jgi:hypothetical protein